ncbi:MULTISPECIES: GH-E family nuclease [unclassified Caulobacter]|uniref:GH-E family nuclease n=1 Tax=unclassified Caulobacter TaxID=2648921 RepID=UPI0006F7952A|nr:MULTISPECIES: GH-E family nuclease [unclassified Caulobacter]KQV56779.1 hypothetical protein ASC62_10725 [Caulobacter sp. Root342]KQV72418.1 hypothetical protein ASC70_01675 [Caulobacter sp. Root343]
MSQMPAARLGDDVAHSQAGLGMLLGVLGGVVAGAVLVGATIATGGAALAVVAAVGGAAGLTSFGGLAGMNIGAAMMGPPTGKFVVGSPNVLINSRPATLTFVSMAVCIKEAGVPIPLATGSSTVFINIGMAGREGEKLGCSAVSVKMTSPNVLIGGESAQDPRVEIKPEVPQWAVTALQVLGVAGAILALPFAIATVGVAATIGGAVLGYYGGKYGGEAGRALGEALGMSEAGKRAMEAGGQFLGGMIGGAAGVKGVRAFNSRYQIVAQPGTLGMNGGNLKIVRRPPQPTTSLKPAKPVSYERPSGFRKGVRDKVWESARGPDGEVRNPGTGEVMDPNKPWDMGHKPGYEFRKHQQSAMDRGISRKEFLNEHNDPSHYRPELPSYNRSHAGEDMTGDYLGF